MAKRPEIVTSEKTGQVVQQIYADQRKIIYRLHVPDEPTGRTEQHELASVIYFHGFDKLPSGFYRDGYGFTTGYAVLKALHEKYGKKLELHFDKIKKSGVQKLKTKTKVTINFNQFDTLQKTIRRIRKERNDEIGDNTNAFLKSQFPNTFRSLKTTTELVPEYQGDQLAEILRDPKVLKSLSKSDVEALAEFYPKFVKKESTGVRTIALLDMAGKTKSRTERVYLSKVLKEFENKIGRANLSENDWQKFLRTYILLFNTNYVKSIEKLSVSLGGKYPDFLLLNTFGYLDIFEIKKPTTQLLRYDKSRDNYFWDPEIAKAISQTENYINSLQQNADAFCNEMRKRHNLEIKVVRPRGFIIAGRSEQLTDEKMRDDFRLLGDALKNIDLILYDEFLERLKNLEGRLAEGEK
ncbi:Shedu immune nuclease family protein [Parasphingopyxis sp.]|uniref:Shedu immune nuclease family protein n=1 Tax=Parasphingopyxis sp. TaxID=1920299 RepID=UPI00262EF49E|nr:Shedu immune nuclease family protein [Parasphingopyxis sp.]